MTDEQLQQIRERAEKATPGPWESKHEQAASGIFAPSEVTKLSMHGKARIAFTGGLVIRNHEADAAFIAAAREDIPALLAEVERLREIVQDVVAGAAPCTVIDGQCHLLGSCEPEWEGPLSPDGYWKHYPECPVTKARTILTEEQK